MSPLCRVKLDWAGLDPVLDLGLRSLHRPHQNPRSQQDGHDAMAEFRVGCGCVRASSIKIRRETLTCTVGRGVSVSGVRLWPDNETDKHAQSRAG